jgi:hypothetical protein
MRSRLFNFCILLAAGAPAAMSSATAAEAATASFEIRGYVPVRCGTELVNGQPAITCNTSDLPVVNVTEHKLQAGAESVLSEIVTGTTKSNAGRPKLALYEAAGRVADFQPLTVLEITL